MSAAAACCPSPRKAERPRLEVADIVREHGEELRQQHRLNPAQEKVLRNIELCRTAALGGHEDVCPHCKHKRPSYNSCLDRHCPKCLNLRQARWVEQRLERLLPVSYFHVVFTLPALLRPLARCNPKAMYDLLFHAASRTLLELGLDEKFFGAQLGITAVLHTWTRMIDYHPHLHCIVTGGGLSLDGGRWIASRSEYLLPVLVLSRLFRGKFLDGLARAYQAGELQFHGGCVELADPQTFQHLKNELYQNEWVVYAKEPFAAPEHVFRYLGRYIHKVAISNERLIKLENGVVHFHTKDGNVAALPAVEFLRRFLLHVLPKGFVKIRHYGLFASSNVKTKLETAKQILEPPPTDDQGRKEDQAPEPYDWREHLRLLTGIDPSVCPNCGKGPMLRVHLAAVEGGPPPGYLDSS